MAEPKSNYKPVKWGRPKKYTSEAKMQKDIDAYFKDCEDDFKPKTVMGLANALNMCRDTLCEYAKDGEFSDIVKKAKNIVAQSWEERLATTSSSGAIFWNKNHGGMRDKVEVDTNLTIKSIGVEFIDGDSKSDS